ncbi:DUF1958 domain-containing protein [Streptococcus caprae]|uniref:DUF1958 domain-containing protein n=1 Tax=Streptococcus caprae TaxID=1640501 RepID=A0ABV8CWA2_9STRE
MKKWSSLLVCMAMMLVQPVVLADELMDITRAAGYEVSDVNRPKASIVIEGITGEILWQDNIDEQRDPASMSKAMTLYMVYEAMEQGLFSEDTVVTATPTDQAIGSIYEISNNKIIAGVDYTVSELITMTIVPSSNVTTLMLARLIEPDPDVFLDRMNAKAEELGMSNTTWNTATGAIASAFQGYYAPTRYDNSLPNQTTARDLGTLIYQFTTKYPQVLEHSQGTFVTVKAGTPYEETFQSYNHSMPEDPSYGLEGVNGFKTGSSPSAGFNCIVTADRDGQKRIAIIMGVGDWSDQNGEYYRHPFVNALLEKSYTDYQYGLVAKAGEQEIDGKTYELNTDFYGVSSKESQPSLQVTDGQLSVANGLETLNATIKDGTKIEEKPANVVEAVKSIVKKPGNKKAWYHLLYDKGLVLIPLFGILALLVVLERKSQQKRKEKRQRP